MLTAASLPDIRFDFFTQLTVVRRLESFDQAGFLEPCGGVIKCFYPVDAPGFFGQSNFLGGAEFFGEVRQHPVAEVF